MTDAILEITDGTVTISLISPTSGFHLTNWVPAITDYKGGGTFQNPPLANWRQLRDSKWATATENFTITLNGQSPNTAAFNLQQIRRLLEKANQYWTTDWQNEPVWVKAKMKCETNTRYCVVVKGRLANDRNFYDQPATGRRSTLQNLPLIIERRAWLENEPHTGDPLAISVVETYNGVNYGNVDDTGTREPKTTEEVFFGNKRNTANITNIHLTTAGANRIGASPPYDIINATGETYFGIDTSIADSGPFFVLVFDIGTAGVGGPTIVWERWTGAAWSSIAGIDDATNDFTNTGVNVITFSITSWSTNSPGGGLPTGYWLRARISAGSFSTEPTQQNRDVYTVTWPYTEVQLTALGGDISALSKLTVKSVSQPGSTGLNRASSVIGGLRSVGRGENFTAYINLSDEQNPAGITVTNLAGGSGSFIDKLRSPTGRVFEYSPAGVVSTPADIVSISFSSSLASEYYGTYRIFVVLDQEGGVANDFALRFDAANAGDDPFFQSELVTVESLDTDYSIDMGSFTIKEQIGVDFEELTFTLYATNSNGTPGNLEFNHVVLIPADEYMFESKTDDESDDARINDSGYLAVNGLIPKSPQSILLDTTNDTLLKNYQYLSNNANPILQANTRQRLWFFTNYITVSGSIVEPISDFRDVFSVQIETNQRYLSLRGNR